MTIEFLLLLASALTGWGGASLAARYGQSVGFIDYPNERSSHASPTPRGGGIGIFAVFLLTSLANGVSTGFWLPVGAMSVFALGSDRFNLSPEIRLCIQLLLMAILVTAVNRLPSTDIWHLPWILFWAVFIVGTANFFNFMDGINGIAGVTGFVGFTLLAFYIYWIEGQSIVYCSLSLCIACSCLGFLPLNMPKAKVFMGDVGSILLGGLFAGIVYMSARTALDFLCMASFLFPFYADELTTMAVRVKNGENLTQPHRKHIYQLLANEKGMPHWQISVTFGLFQLFVGISVILMKPFGCIAVLSLLAVCFTVFTLGAWRLRVRIGSHAPMVS